VFGAGRLKWTPNPVCGGKSQKTGEGDKSDGVDSDPRKKDRRCPKEE